MLKKDITKQKLKAMLENYLHEHQEYYTDAEKKYIMENFSSGLFTDFSDALLRQIYSELSLIDDEHNIYLGFTNLQSPAISPLTYAPISAINISVNLSI